MTWIRVDSGFKYWIPDSSSVELRFRISIASGILDSLSSIPDSRAQYSGLHKQNHPDSGIPIPLNMHAARHVSLSIRLSCWGKGERETQTGETAKERNVLFLSLLPTNPLSPLTFYEGMILKERRETPVPVLLPSASYAG